MLREQIYKTVLREFEKKRLVAELELDNRKTEIYERLSRVREIDDEISKGGVFLAVSALNDPKKSSAHLSRFKEKTKALIKEKEAILKENGIPKKYLEIHNDCKACKDSGYIDGEECKCFRQRRIELAYNTYSLKDKLKSENFDNFDLRYYSTKTEPPHQLSPKKNMEKIAKYCLKYIEQFDTKYANLLFFGNPGLGKTFLCNCIARELLDKGYSVMYLTAFKLFKMLDDIQFGRLEQEDRQSILDDILNVDLLIIDDIGTEFLTGLTGAGFFNTINSRSNAKKPVIVSTNLSPDELKELYSERIYSRIIGDYTFFGFYGEDVRSLKKFGKFLD